MSERGDCKHYRIHDRIQREGNRKDAPWEVVSRFYCVKGKAKVDGCPDCCNFFEPK